MIESSPQADRKHHVDAVHFVHHAIKHAARDERLQRDGLITGEGLCRVLLELAVDEFGAAGQSVLLQWNVRDSRDIGMIVARMREAGVDEAQHVDPNATFAAWFDLEQPAEHWALKW